MNINEEYYVLERENIDEYPVLAWGNTNMPSAMQLPENTFFELIWAEPAPLNGLMVDYHAMPDAVISNKIKMTLEKENLEEIQFISTNILDL